ncbi:hypothetical protein [Actomonas aquatica]|uniref:GYF domain-containing protein n=1 Tax=Actomonas aquatica TaxID=2866162 RepID=A0ABZ1C2B7_9BACT|nr:hypothetical protein [Opitutus sp. WL0086]WRQ85705.1 hypothetical protein K1X11_012905 [Opitutus sp. WL0086]
MAIWEYKVISSGKGGFANPQLLENFLNQLGKDEWEIIDFRTAPDNPLAFNGLARRGTQRDWTLEAAQAAQTKAEEEKNRAELAAARAAKEAAERDAEKAREAAAAAIAGEGDEEGSHRDESLRTLRDTERDDDPEALAEEAEAASLGDDWDEMSLDDDLPTLFDAIKPHLRRNQKGLGEAAAIDYLARRWEQEPEDVLGALQECGLTVPENDDDLPEYFEFEGDLYWLNRNNRGQTFINVREKPRPRFKPTQMRKLDPEDPASEELRAEHEAEQEKKRAAQAEREAREAERAARKAAAEAEANKPPEPLPEGEAVIELVKPKMRRNRRGPGQSGSLSFLAKALKHSEEDLLKAFESIGLKLAEKDDEKPAFVEVGDEVYWLKKDGRGGVWINARDKDKLRNKDKDAVKPKDAESEAADAAADEDQSSAEEKPAEPVKPAAEADADDATTTETEEVEVKFEPGAKALPALRLLLKPKSRGNGAAAEIDTLARKLNKPAVELLEALVKAGLNVPDDADEKPKFAELGDEILWLNRNAKDDSLWLNAKTKPKRSRSRSTTKKTTKKAATEKASDAGSADKKAAPEESSDAAKSE